MRRNCTRPRLVRGLRICQEGGRAAVTLWTVSCREAKYALNFVDLEMKFGVKGGVVWESVKRNYSRVEVAGQHRPLMSFQVAPSVFAL